MPNIGGNSPFSWLSSFGANLSGSFRGRPRSQPTGRNLSYGFTVGSGAMQVNWEWDDESGTIAASGNVLIDLTALIDDISEATLTVASLKYLRVVNASANAATIIRVGNAATNAIVGPMGTAAGTQDVYSAGGVGTANLPGEYVNCNPTAAGWTIDATHKIIKILNLDAVNAAAYYIYLGGS